MIKLMLLPFKVAWWMLRLALDVTRAIRSTRVRPTSRSCIKWHPDEAAGGRLGDGLKAAGHGDGACADAGLIPERLDPERTALAQDDRGAGSGLEHGPIVLHMAEDGSARPGKSNLIEAILGRLLPHGGSADLGAGRTLHATPPENMQWLAEPKDEPSGSGPGEG